MSDVTRLLDVAEAGDRKSAADLLPLVYAELRALAAARMAAEAPGHTLDATALVHEAYIRLLGPADDSRWQNRGHFFAAAAESMRCILIDHARKKKAAKRSTGRDEVHLELDQLPARLDADLLAVDEVLSRFASFEPTGAELVKLRYFAGLTIPEAAATLGMSPRSADRLWAYARAWFHRELSRAAVV